MYKINKSSWHYKLVSDSYNRAYGAYYESVLPKDFCSYWRALIAVVIKAIIMWALIAAVVSAGIVIIGGLLYMFCDAVYNNPLETVITVGLVIFAISIPITIEYISRSIKIRRYERAKKAATEHGNLAATKYKSWKSSVCLPVEYEND